MTHTWMGCMKKIFKLGEAGKQSRAAKQAGPMTRVLQPAYTRRLRPESQESENTVVPDIKQPATARLVFDWHGMTDTGRVRPHNEDSFSCRAFDAWSLFVVADGMGGHDAGEVASKIAVDTVCKKIEERIKRSNDLTSLVQSVVQEANSAVKQEGESKGSNMGTTLSLALVSGETAYIANVGDSRVYWIENGSITQITEDHSLVAKLMAVGKLTKEEARGHPKSNLLYRTIGTDPTIKVDTFQVTLSKGGGLLLCTDGLWGEVDDESIYRVFGAEKDARSTGVTLVKMANENGGKDNITAVAVRVK